MPLLGTPKSELPPYWSKSQCNEEFGFPYGELVLGRWASTPCFVTWTLEALRLGFVWASEA